MVGLIILSGCGGISLTQNLAIGEFVGSATGIGDDFTTWMDIQIRPNGRIDGWGDIGTEERPTTITGTAHQDGHITLNIIEDGAGTVHTLSGKLRLERVTMSGEVERNGGARAYLELVRIDPL